MKFMAAVVWFCGIIIAGDFFVLPVAIAAILAAGGIPASVQKDVIQLWLQASVAIAGLPVLAMMIGVIDDRYVETGARIGKWLLLYGNPAGWVLVLIWRWVIKPSPVFWLVAAVMSPSKYPKDD